MWFIIIAVEFKFSSFSYLLGSPCGIRLCGGRNQRSSRTWFRGGSLNLLLRNRFIEKDQRTKRKRSNVADGKKMEDVDGKAGD